MNFCSLFQVLLSSCLSPTFIQSISSSSSSSDSDVELEDKSEAACGFNRLACVFGVEILSRGCPRFATNFSLGSDLV